MMIDNHGRRIDYVRLAVTDKCNLRCFYCMPESGIDFKPKSEMLSFEETIRLMQILALNGISKVRITGGEPFLRKDLMSLLKSISEINGIEKIAITTNGTMLLPHLDELLKLGIRNFNLSIDSIDESRFASITRRDSFSTVWDCYKTLLQKDIDLKLNCVVMNNRNIEDIIPMVALSKNDDVSIRFIEEMPFNGNGINDDAIAWDYVKILEHIKSKFPNIKKLKDPSGSTSMNYQVEGFKGTFGIIPAYSRTFCGSCNRIRITPTGLLKTCLYDNGIFNVKDLMRKGADDQAVSIAIKEAVSHRAKDGFEAEKNRNHLITESMATIGG